MNLLKLHEKWIDDARELYKYYYGTELPLKWKISLSPPHYYPSASIEYRVQSDKTESTGLLSVVDDNGRYVVYPLLWLWRTKHFRLVKKVKFERKRNFGDCIPFPISAVPSLLVHLSFLSIEVPKFHELMKRSFSPIFSMSENGFSFTFQFKPPLPYWSFSLTFPWTANPEYICNLKTGNGRQCYEVAIRSREEMKTFADKVRAAMLIKDI